MKKYTILLSALLLIVIGCEKNQAPQITTIESLTKVIVGGSEVLLKVNCSDENGDALTYNWNANGGEIISTTTSDSLVWKAPTSISEDSYTISVDVSDGEVIVKEELIITVEGGKFIDQRDNNIYDFIQIGEQIWMAKNLAFLPSVSLSNIGSNSKPFWYVYGYDGIAVDTAKATENYSIFGALYNWEAAKIACTVGWHLPSDDEWKSMEIFLGMSKLDADSISMRNSGSVGTKLKSSEGWNYDGNGDNSSGFNALPGGQIFPNNNNWDCFRDKNSRSCFWTATLFSSVRNSVWIRFTRAQYEGVGRYDVWHSHLGYSVRCIKDE